MQKTLTIEQLHKKLTECYAVSVNDTLYFVGWVDDSPYVSDNFGDDQIDFSVVDGDIEVTESGVFFYVASDPVELKFLQVSTVAEDTF